MWCSARLVPRTCKGLLPLVCLLALVACDGPMGPTGPEGPPGPQGPPGPPGPPGASDKVVRLPFFSGGVSFAWNQTDPFDLPPQTYVVKFNKQHYVDVDSILFVAALWTASPTSHAIAEVYNHTDGAVVANGTLQTTSTTPVWVESGNLFGSLPEKEVTLGIRLRSEVAGGEMDFSQAAFIGAGYLLLYRR